MKQYKDKVIFKEEEMGFHIIERKFKNGNKIYISQFRSHMTKKIHQSIKEIIEKFEGIIKFEKLVIENKEKKLKKDDVIGIKVIEKLDNHIMKFNKILIDIENL